MLLQAEQMVEVEAERRLASIGNDRSQWPTVAREEVTRLETKHQVRHCHVPYLPPCISQACKVLGCATNFI